MDGTDASGPGSVPSRVDPLGDPFLRTRFALPTRPATFLRRERLVGHLDQALLTPLTMVNGAAGAGKTLLVADWAAGLRQPVAWLTADEADQRPGMFWAYVLEALRVAGVPAPDEVGCPADAGRVDRTLLTRLAADLSGRDPCVVVVLDEYDRVAAPVIAEQLEFVLHHAGQGMRLILVTRTEPLLPLHRYRAAGEMTEIRGAELAFTPQEAVTLLGLHGLRLPVHAAGALVDRTRGWAAGLRLCALAAQESPDPETYLKEFEADHSTVADFLLAEVLKRQSAETQDLLLRVSVLDRFCPDLANALTHRTDAEPILAGLHRENAFVEHLGHSWYRLHPLFGEILRAHLRVRLPGLEPRLHRWAAQWSRRGGSLSATLAHGAAAGDWEFTAGALVDDLAIGQLFAGLRCDDLAELFAGMDAEATSPATDVVRAARDLAHGDIDRGLTHLRRAEEGLAGDVPDRAAARLSCALLEALAARLTGSPARAEKAADAAETLRHDVPAALLDEHPELTALLLTHVGSTRLWAGRFPDARSALSTVAGGANETATALPRAESLGHLALIDYLHGWPRRAERKVLAAAAGPERSGPPRPVGPGIGRLVLAAVAVDRDELADAEDLLAEAGGTGHEGPDPVTAAARALATSRLLLARGDPRAALEATQPYVSTDEASPWATAHAALVASAAHLAEGRPDRAADVLRQVPHDQPACSVEAARVELVTGNPGAALDRLDGIRTEGGRMGPAVVVRAALVRAQAADGAGDTAAARSLVARALREARHERLRRPFLEAGPWIRPLLAEAAPQRPTAVRPARGPSRGAGQSRHEEQPPSPVVEALSDREREVLRRVAQMMSTEEVAADLYVSVNTVKTHLKGAYRKLAVNRRSDAVRRARELRLL